MISNENPLIQNIDKIHTTEMGKDRIKRNVNLTTDDVVHWCKLVILNKNSIVNREGKNWYLVNGNHRITINAHSYTIITAHLIKK